MHLKVFFLTLSIFGTLKFFMCYLWSSESSPLVIVRIKLEFSISLKLK